jgi:hypothetical protein
MERNRTRHPNSWLAKGVERYLRESESRLCLHGCAFGRDRRRPLKAAAFPNRFTEPSRSLVYLFFAASVEALSRLSRCFRARGESRAKRVCKPEFLISEEAPPPPRNQGDGSPRAGGALGRPRNRASIGKGKLPRLADQSSRRSLQDHWGGLTNR